MITYLMKARKRKWVSLNRYNLKSDGVSATAVAFVEAEILI